MVTGATNGIGRVAALQLAQRGATVAVVSRNAQRVADTVHDAQVAGAHMNVSGFTADLTSLSDTRVLAERLREHYPAIHGLINNAGGVFLARKVTTEGLEETWALNVVTPFLLTRLLEEPLRAAAAPEHWARVVNVSSGAHMTARGLNWDDVGFARRYFGFAAYSHAKLAEVMLSLGQARAWRDRNISVNALHPGFVNTGFGRESNRWLRLAFTLITPFALSPEDGARTTLFAAASPEVEGLTGRYFEKERVARYNRVAAIEADQDRLLRLLEEQTGLKAEA